jgi:biopolymer transport protein ExbD
LASSRNATDISDAPLVSLIRGRVFVDADDAGEVSLDASRTERLPLVVRSLEDRRKFGRVLQPNRPVPNRVLLQIDRDAPAHHVKQLVASVSAAGYEGVSFLVMRSVP